MNYQNNVAICNIDVIKRKRPAFIKYHRRQNFAACIYSKSPRFRIALMFYDIQYGLIIRVWIYRCNWSNRWHNSTAGACTIRHRHRTIFYTHTARHTARATNFGCCIAIWSLIVYDHIVAIFGRCI